MNRDLALWVASIRWEAHWADTRIHGTTKRLVAAMFVEEQPALGPLPLEPFRHYRFGVRTVHLDGCVEVEAAYYGTPPGWLGRRVVRTLTGDCDAKTRPCVQSRARRYGIPGIYGNVGTLESATYSI